MAELTQKAFKSRFASATTRIELDTLTIIHSQADTIRLVDNTEDVQRAAGLYVRFPFRSVYPALTDQRPPTLNIDVDIVDHRIMLALRSLRGLRERPLIIVETVTADDPDNVIWGPGRFRYEDFSTDSVAKGTLKASFIKGALNNAYPARRISPSSAGA